MVAECDAKIVILKNIEQSTREFHRYAARLRARGHVVNTGDRLIAYQVHSTIPEGPVLVTDKTEFVFAS